MLEPFRRTLPLGVVLAVVAACSDVAGPEPTGEGTFVAHLEGVVDASLDGPASLVADPDGTWSLTLEAVDGLGAVTFTSRPRAGGPGVGEHALVDSTTADGGNAPGEYLIARVDLAPQAIPGDPGFDFLVGTLTVAVAAGHGIQGSFQLATTVTGEPTRALIVRGEFTVP